MAKPAIARKWKAGELHTSCVEYFDWAHDNPLHEARPFAYQGDSWVEEVAKARAFTRQGLCTFLGVSIKEWDSYKDIDDLMPVYEWAEQVIYQQKFELAASDLLNASFIARDLGMTDKRELGGIPGQPLEVSAREQLLDRLAGIAAALGTAAVDPGADGS